MHKELKIHLDEALKEYTSGIHYDTLLEAKEKYFEITGAINDEDDDYENRMSSFNDWYVLQFVSKRGTRTVIKDYLENKKIDDKICKSLLSFNFSLFEYLGKNFKGQEHLKDILHDKKVILADNHPKISLLKNDVFISRTLEFDGQVYLMNGLCVLPQDSKSILKKQARKIRKMKVPEEEIEFLMQTESLKTKWLRYGHIEVSKIFVYP